MHNRMTEGSPLKLILMFAMPVLLGNVFQQFYNMADTMMVGRILGVDALAAMGATASVSGLVLGLNIGLAQGFAIPIAAVCRRWRHGESQKSGSGHADAGGDLCSRHYDRCAYDRHSGTEAVGDAGRNQWECQLSISLLFTAG